MYLSLSECQEILSSWLWPAFKDNMIPVGSGHYLRKNFIIAYNKVEGNYDGWVQPYHHVAWDCPTLADCYLKCLHIIELHL